MRAFFYPFQCFAVAAVLAVGAFSGPALRAASFDGQYYVPLADFARANGFSVSTLRRGDEDILNGRGLRLVFDINSAQAQIAGVNVRLSFPIASDHAQLFISQLDIDTALKPLLYPQKSYGKKITTICIDPGHGGRDSGYHVGGFGFLGHSEKTYTLALALELREQLRHAGFRVILTRNRDVYVHLPDRPSLANSEGADLFISLHFNGYFGAPADEAAIEGPETYCITPVGAPSSNAHGQATEFGSSVGAGPTAANHDENKSLLLAYEMEKSLVLSLHADDRGVRRARFEVLRYATMPAILIEGGYITNPVESKKIYNAGYRTEMAAAIVKGILAYQKVIAPAALHSNSETHRVRLQ